MIHTKNILKSLLIMIVAISLFTVSCSKDEGGTKTPTTPTIQKVSADMITQVLKDLGPLKGTEADANTTMVDLSAINPQDGKATIGNADKRFAKVKEALQNVASTPQEILEVTDNLSTVSKPEQKNPLNVELTFKVKANSGYEFDETITKPQQSAKKYIYDEAGKTAKLTLEITPAADWEA